ncbi:MAG TPA: hypothetical protein VLA49_06820 [Anaerolineales bacterium]|nr:hypothetical protein [Anaerolineales bacterium]
MGYIHDVNMIAILGPEIIQIDDAQAWDDKVASNLWTKDRTAGASTFMLKIPVFLPQNTVSGIGSYIRAIDIWYTVLTDPLTSLSATIYKAARPANGAAWGAPVSQAFTYDSGHSGAPGRVTVAYHMMTLTITTPFWLLTADEAYVQIAAQAAGTPVIKYHGARLTYTLRL